MSKVTLRIIAEKSGMSKYAVSRALSGKDGVSEATRQRIMEVADELGYERPTPPSQSEVVAIFDDRDHVNAELHSQILAGLQREAGRLNYDLRSHWLHHGGSIEDVLRNAGAVFAINVSDETAKRAIEASGVPVVHSGWTGPLAQVDVVGGTDHGSGEAVVNHLHTLGHREIVYVHGTGDLRGRRVRLSGARVAAEVTGTTIHDLSWEEDSSFSEAFTRLLRKNVRPTALFCAHDTLAMAVVTDLLSRGWRIPQDVTIIGFGDFTPARLVSPPLTTVRVKGQEMGRTLARIMHLRTTDADWPGVPLQIRVVNELIVRSTCGPPPTVHPLDREPRA
ncbi:LacI family DNA-binding transcriptional regulator [Pelagovum pacificum]|nr:LacI family DNA-binding transcriptional regulator [Pelagovum pacificum]QQA41757.1 LacI family DNA-binding transcriptional regulator [Pelagovum pacificum]